MYTGEKINLETIQLKTGVAALFFLLIAYLSHLGFIPLNHPHDEARRAVVTAEMMLSGDYLTPTINGELYLNKPPLYNWIVAGYFKAFGNWSMFAFRLPVIIAALATGIAVYLFTKKYTDKRVAFFAAFAFLTNGRLLIYDSFLGLIDTTFALVIYLSFMLTWHFGEKKKYYYLFISTYLLAALAFLLKGFPAIAFQGLTLLTYFIWRKKFKLLFYGPHWAGIAVFLMVTGSYYIAYFSRNDIAPLSVFSNLLQESSKRTVVKFGIWKTILHFLTFPGEILYHYAPWTLFIVVVFRKNIITLLRKNDFVFYSLLVFTANILIYWTSPQVYARFLFMFLPLLYTILFYVFFEILTEKNWQQSFIRFITIFFTALLGVCFLLLPFLQLAEDRSFIYLKCFSLAVLFGLLSRWMIKYKDVYLYGFLLAVIFFRIGFNWYILEPRAANPKAVDQMASRIANSTKGSNLFILQGADIRNFDGLSFHIAIRRQQVLGFKKEKDTTSCFIAGNKQLQGETYTSFFSFINDSSDSLQLVKFR